MNPRIELFFRKPSWLAAGLGLVAGGVWWLTAGDAPAPAHLAEQVSYRRMADSLHAVLRAADTTFLARQAAEPAAASLSHAEFLRRMAREIATHGAEFSFALRALDPLDPRAAPQTQVEQDALKAFRRAGGAARPRLVEEQLGGRAYFTAVYPARATRTSCADCHNRDPRGSRHDFRRGDVMGAWVIRLPREF
jgi:hypothetical protein